MSCSVIQKLAFMPGCRPWDTPDPVQSEQAVPFTLNIPYVSTPVPYAPPDVNAGEFSLPVAVKSSVSKITAEASRLFSSTKAQTSQGEAPAWYDISGKISSTASSVNDALQSTLIKVIVLVVIVGVFALFGMTYVQAKGAQLAK